MRLSLRSVGALAAVMLVSFAFWPENRAVRGPEPTVAQDSTKRGKPQSQKPREESKSSQPAPSDQGAARETPDATQTRLKETADYLKQRRAAAASRSRHEEPLSSDDSQDPAILKIREVLAQTIDFTIEPQPLKDAIGFIATRYQIPILIDEKALDDANVDTKSEVKINAPNIRLHYALDLLLSELSSPLSYEIRNGVLMISTIEKIAEHQEVIVYDCRDLVQVRTLELSTVLPSGEPKSAHSWGIMDLPPEQTKATTVETKPAPKGIDGPLSSEAPGTRAGQRLPLIQTIMAATGHDSWDDGTITEFGGLLIVRQNPLVHERIKRLLADIRRIRAGGAFSYLAPQYDAELKRRSTDEAAAKLPHESRSGGQPKGVERARPLPSPSVTP
jgi:hypothetical protein